MSGALRQLYVYRLVVVLPELKNDEPDNWDEICRVRGWAASTDQGDEYDGPGATTFSWPRRRLFFSATSARKRADYLRECGATVTIERSWPVTFPTSDGRVPPYRGSQEDEPAPCYICGAEIVDGQLFWFKDGKSWCHKHQPIWSREP